MSVPANVQADPTAAQAPAMTGAPAASQPVTTAAAEVVSLKVEIKEIQGDISVKREGGSEFKPLTASDELRSGDLVRALEGTCHLLIDGKINIYVQPNTSLRVSEALRESKGDAMHLQMESGRIKVQLPKLRTGSSFEVTTPAAIATVRGTTFFLNVGDFGGHPGTQMYVDETKGGVLYKNTKSGDSYLVPQFTLANSFLDGVLSKMQPLTPEQQKAFIDAWQNGSSSNQQFGIEELPTVPALPDNFLPDQKDLNDAMIDKLLENPLGVGFEPPVVLPTPTLKNPPDDNPPPKEEENPPKDEETPPDNNGGGVEQPTTPVEVTPEDRAAILSTLDSVLNAQEFDLIDANQAQTIDAQTGKVFSDVHGNRVRVDQYITQPSPDAVMLLSLTQRSGEYQNGITAMGFFTQFNRPITEQDGPLRGLPWNEYLNVVRRDELTGGGVPGQFESFIVHEHVTDLGQQPDLYPFFMGALFVTAINETTLPTNAGGLFFSEFYSNPFVVQADQGNFWVQGVEEEFNFGIAGEESFFSIFSGIEEFRTVIVNSQEVALSSREGAQTAGLPTHAGLADLDTPAGLDFFRNNESVHPAFFEDLYGDNRVLYGIFLPINDNGQVIDAPGFTLHSIRDLVYPNTQVNGGNYNLELIFGYGSLDNGVYSELFRIDSIITPEIFTEYGLKNPDGSRVGTLFPSTLEPEQNV